MRAFEELSDTIAAITEQLGDSVVGLGRGTGTVIGEGHVLTNAHNLTDEEPQVRFADGRTETGHLLAADIDGDLAVVAVATAGAPAVSWAESSPRTGAPLLALAPTRTGRPRVTFGFVSADGQAFRGPRGRRIHGAIEHTAPLGRGSSGGPVVDLDGRLVGVNTHRRGDGFYLAQPVTEELQSRVEELTHGRAPHTAHLGVTIAPARVARHLRAAVGLDPRDGVLVREVTAEGPAARAGVREGDLIVAADGSPVTSPDDLLDRLRGVGERLLLGLVRGVEELELEVAFAADGGAGQR